MGIILKKWRLTQKWRRPSSVKFTDSHGFSFIIMLFTKKTKLKMVKVMNVIIYSRLYYFCSIFWVLEAFVALLVTLDPLIRMVLNISSLLFQWHSLLTRVTEESPWSIQGPKLDKICWLELSSYLNRLCFITNK